GGATARGTRREPGAPSSAEGWRRPGRPGLWSSRGSSGVGSASQGPASRVARPGAQLLFDPQELVVLGDPLAAGWSARLDLAEVERDRQVGDERIFGLPRAMGEDRRVAAAPRGLDGEDRLAQ